LRCGRGIAVCDLSALDPTTGTGRAPNTEGSGGMHGKEIDEVWKAGAATKAELVHRSKREQ